MKLTQPAGLGSSWNSGASTATVSWNAVVGATGYTVSVSPAPPSGPSSIVVASPATSTSFPVSAGQKYTVTVVATAGFTSPSASAPQVLTMTAPTGLTRMAQWGYEVSFNWAAGIGNSSYRVDMGPFSGVISPVTGFLKVNSAYNGATLAASVTPFSSSGVLGPASGAISVQIPSRSWTSPREFAHSPSGDTAASSSLVSSNGQYVATLQHDGNFVVYDTTTRAPRQHTHTFSGAGGRGVATTLAFQSDGNLVAYGGAGVLAYTHTEGIPVPATLTLEDDGNLILRDAYGTVRWALVGGPDTGVGNSFMYY